VKVLLQMMQYADLLQLIETSTGDAIQEELRQQDELIFHMVYTQLQGESIEIAASQLRDYCPSIIKLVMEFRTRYQPREKQMASRHMTAFMTLKFRGGAEAALKAHQSILDDFWDTTSEPRSTESEQVFISAFLNKLPGEYVLLRRDLSRFISSDIPVDWAAFCTELRRLHRDIYPDAPGAGGHPGLDPRVVAAYGRGEMTRLAHVTQGGGRSGGGGSGGGRSGGGRGGGRGRGHPQPQHRQQPFHHNDTSAMRGRPRNGNGAARGRGGGMRTTQASTAGRGGSVKCYRCDGPHPVRMCPHQPVGTVPTSQRDRLVRALALTGNGQTTSSSAAQTSINHIFIDQEDEHLGTPSIETAANETDEDLPELLDASQPESSSTSSDEEPAAGEWTAPRADGSSQPEADDYSILYVAVGRQRHAATTTRRRGVGTPHGFRPSSEHTEESIQHPVLLFEDDVLLSPAVVAVTMGARAISTSHIERGAGVYEFLLDSGAGVSNTKIDGLLSGYRAAGAGEHLGTASGAREPVVGYGSLQFGSPCDDGSTYMFALEEVTYCPSICNVLSEDSMTSAGLTVVRGPAATILITPDGRFIPTRRDGSRDFVLMVMGGPETTLAAVDLLEPPQVLDSVGDGEAVEEIAATTVSQHVIQIGNTDCAQGEAAAGAAAEEEAAAREAAAAAAVEEAAAGEAAAAGAAAAAAAVAEAAAWEAATAEAGLSYELAAEVAASPDDEVAALRRIRGNDALLWHGRLAHVGMQSVIRTLRRHDIAYDAHSSDNCAYCLLYDVRRQPLRQQLRTVVTVRREDAGEDEGRFVCDLFGPLPEPTMADGIFIFVAVARYDNYVYVQELSSKSLTYLAVRGLVRRLGPGVVRVLRCDNEKVFVSLQLQQECAAHGIQLNHSEVYWSETNGLAERYVGLISTRGRCALAASGLPDRFAGYAYLHTASVMNSLVNERLGVSPTEYRHLRLPRLQAFRWFGCKVYVMRPKRNVHGKLDSRAYPALYIQQDHQSSNTVVFDLESNKLRTCASYRDLEADLVITARAINAEFSPATMSADAILDMTPSLRADQFPDDEGRAVAGDNMLVDAAMQTADEEPATTSPGPGGSVEAHLPVANSSAADCGGAVSTLGGDRDDVAQPTTTASVPASASATTTSTLAAVPATLAAVPATRRSRRLQPDGGDAVDMDNPSYNDNIILRRLHTDLADTFYQPAASVLGIVNSIPVPKSLTEALAGQWAAQWQVALDAEYTQWQRNDAVQEVSFSDMRDQPGVLAMVFLVFTVKYDSEGDPIFKIRAVGDGRRQEFSSEIERLRLSSSSLTTVHNILVHLAVAAGDGSELLQCDVTGAYFHGKPDADAPPVYLKLPPGWPSKWPGQATVLRVTGNIYGMCDAGVKWEVARDRGLNALGLSSRPVDRSFFTDSKTFDGASGASALAEAAAQGIEFEELTNVVNIRFQSYVDDGIVSGRLLDAMLVMLRTLHHDYFQFGELSRLRKVLGVNITETDDEIFLCMKDYCKKLESAGLLTVARPQLCPLSLQDVRNGALDPAPEGFAALAEDIKLYQTVMGSLLWAAVTLRLDALLATAKLAQFTKNPTHLNIKASLRVLQYLIFTPCVGLSYPSSRSAKMAEVKARGEFNVLIGYCDADLAGDVATKRSTNGGIIMLNGTPVSFWSQRQRKVVGSSAEAEIYAIYELVRRIEQFRELMAAIGYPQHAPSVCYSDSLAALKGVFKSSAGKGSRHYSSAIAFLREAAGERKTVLLQHLAGRLNPADILTKVVDQTTFDRHVSSLMTVSAQPVPKVQRQVTLDDLRRV